jgi:DNA-binding response OmpR family regulator
MVADDAKGHEMSLTIDAEREQVLLNNCVVSLTDVEFRILKLLTSRPRHTFSRREILDASLGVSCPSLDSTVSVHICHLRRKLEACGGRIETVRRKGFRFRQLPGDAPELCRC